MSVIELLIAAMVTSVVSAGVLGAVAGGQRAFTTQAEAADVRQRLRVGVDALTRDLMLATDLVAAPGGITIVQGAVRHTYYRDAVASQLRHDDGQGTDLPVVDQVTELTFAEEAVAGGGRRVRVSLAVGRVAAVFAVAPRNMNVWP